MRRQTLDAAGVESLYRELLGREVESDAVLQDHLKGHRTPESLRLSIMQSDEYLAKNPRVDLWRFLSGNIARRGPRIDVEVSPEQLVEIFARIEEQWSALGASEPHWSVLTNDKFRTANFAGNEEEFFRSGRHVAALAETFAARNGVDLRRGHALEFGCGTGRITAALAGAFDKVTAVDVSAGHLALCREAMAKSGADNVHCLRLDSLQALESLPACSFLLSTIVLQHNPPPLIAHLLDWLLCKVQPGGAALFQVPTHTPGYQFDVNKYLASAPPKDFEMHCIPMHHVFALLQRHGFTPREVIMDTWTGMPGSHTFFATKS